jgi:hypothetical protein
MEDDDNNNKRNTTRKWTQKPLQGRITSVYNFYFGHHRVCMIKEVE